MHFNNTKHNEIKEIPLAYDGCFWLPFALKLVPLKHHLLRLAATTKRAKISKIAKELLHLYLPMR